MGILNKLVNYLSAKKNDNFLDGESNKVEKSEKEWDQIEVDKLIKAGVDPVIAESMMEMEKHNKLMDKLFKQNK